MKKTLCNILLFTAGAVVGSLVTWKFVKTRYEQILQEEIDSFKETYTLCMNHRDDSEDEGQNESDVDETDDEDDPDMINYAALAGKYGRTSEKVDENDEEGEGDASVPYINGPYVIAPEDFADGNYKHNLCCLTYYADNVLADDWWEVLDIEETIGQESLEHFGDYVEDVVHVRNERLEIDYEVTKDPRNFADIVATDPLMRAYAD